MAGQRKYRNKPRRKRSSRRVRIQRTDPPPVVTRPWNRHVLMFQLVAGSGANIQRVAPVDLNAQLIASGAISSGSSVEIRVQRASVYNISSAPLEVSYADIRDSDQPATGTEQVQAYKTMLDFGGKNHFAALHWAWPRWMREIPLASNSNAPLFTFTSGLPGDTTYVIRVTLLWRSAQNLMESLMARNTIIRPAAIEALDQEGFSDDDTA